MGLEPTYATPGQRNHMPLIQALRFCDNGPGYLAKILSHHRITGLTGTSLAAFSVLRTAKGGRLETFGKRASNVARKKVCVKMKTQSWMVTLLMKLMPFRRTERFYAGVASKMDGLWIS